MDDVDAIKADIKGKKGPDLFRELLRHYPLSFVDDYYKHGIWQDDLMRLDIQILAAHRLEAGAPDPLPLSEIKMPDIPPSKLLTPMMTGPLGSTRPPLASPLQPAGALTVPSVGLGTIPATSSSLATVGIAASPASAGAVTAAVTDLRQIALFVSKWQLDPVRTNTLLAKLAPARRLFVMQNFQDTVGTNGAAPTSKLEEYIAECEQNNSWGSATSVAPAPTTVTAAAAASFANLKRGIEQLQAAAAAAGPREVRPRLGTPGVPLVTNPNWKAPAPVPHSQIPIIQPPQTGPAPSIATIRPGQVRPAATWAR